MRHQIVSRNIATRSPIPCMLLSGLCLIGASLALCKQTLAEPVSIHDPAPSHKQSNQSALTDFRFNDALELKGWKVGETMYLGQTRIGTKWVPGLVLDGGAYAYAINHKGISFSVRF